MSLDTITEGLGLLPWLVMAGILIPLLLLAHSHRRWPTPKLAFPLIVPALLSPLAVINEGLAPLILLLDALLVAFFLMDFFSLKTLSDVHITRHVPRTASLGAETEITLLVENRSTLVSLRGALREDLPAGVDVQPAEQPLRLPPLSRATLRFQMTPRQRGPIGFRHVYLRTQSQWGFWQQFDTLNVEDRVSVYPNIRQLTEYSLLARTDRLSLIGVRRTRQIGQDNEFERLRDYSRDDNYRHIDWRSTARRNRLTVRQFQSDQSQRLLIMLDCGRMMTNRSGDLTLFDHALNASLMLAHVALHQGDSVGLICFSDRVHAYLPPQGGRGQTNRLLHAVYNQFPSMVESRYDQAFLYLANHCRRRTLVVLCTNMIDQVNADQIHSYLGNLTGRHLPLLVLLRDHQLFDAADHPQVSGMGLYRAAAAAEILCWRHQVIAKLKHAGVLALDVFPEEMSAPLVNQYLEVKAKHML